MAPRSWLRHPPFRVVHSTCGHRPPGRVRRERAAAYQFTMTPDSASPNRERVRWSLTSTATDEDPALDY